jgi:hypothetical protein
MAIKFTQFVHPHGRKVPVAIDHTPEVEALAEEMVKQGCLFEIEVLPGMGMVNMDIQPPDGAGVFAVEVVPNGPEVVEAVERLVRRAHARWKQGPPWDWDQEDEQDADCLAIADGAEGLLVPKCF